MGLLIALGCLAIVWRQVDLKQSWNVLGHLSGPFLLIPVAVFCINLPLRAWRWQIIFPPSFRPSFWSCLVVLGIGNMANFLLPGRAGDISRCALVGPNGSFAESSQALATLAVEKVIDGLALIGMVLYSIWILQPARWVLDVLRLAVLIFGGASFVLVVLRYRTPACINAVRRVFRWIHLSAFENKSNAFLTSFGNGLSAVGSSQQMLALILITTAIWMSEATLIWGLAKALSLAVTLKGSIVASAILGLGLMIPGTPGGLGTYELFGTKAFQLTGLSVSNAFALTVVIHAWVFIANIVAGVCLLTVKGITLAQLKGRVGPETSSRVQPYG